MTKTDLIQHFGSVSAVAAALNIKQPSVSAWAEELPVLRQLEIEAMTAGLLRAGPECDRYRVPQDNASAALDERAA